ncbi:MAG: shikimate dehydrogenase [Henriciella sp.]|nr:shikimate dehydrogenase [Henriciella sp.]
MTLLLGVIGDPISHSLSPLIHNGWLRAAGIDAVYEAMQVAKGELPGALDTLSKRDVVGVNVTLPHKEAAFKAASSATADAEVLGVANTLTLNHDAGNWSAANTDVPGFIRALELAGETELNGKTVTVLGAGGSARAVVHALVQNGANVVILNRTVERARLVCERLGNSKAVYGPIDLYRDYIDESKLVVNTASFGHSGDYLALPTGRDRLFFDISYGRPAKAQLEHAKKERWRTADGLGMLVAQAAFSFKIWFGETPDEAAALRKCRRAVEVVP